jgi:hypothetical protein
MDTSAEAGNVWKELEPSPVQLFWARNQERLYWRGPAALYFYAMKEMRDCYLIWEDYAL